ncbi:MULTISPECIES: hypothetical protein [unclassified Streptomyces]|uniref:hypothetical protein n=1 Tax=unclassified Streptomyces TaxID=2593676 RepID=UPI0033C02BF2
MLDEELPQGGIVGNRIRPGELEPCAAAAEKPGPTDVVGLFVFDGPWSEAEFALGDVGPDEC